VSEDEAVYGSKEKSDESAQYLAEVVEAQARDNLVGRRSRVGDAIRCFKVVNFKDWKVRDLTELAELFSVFRHRGVEYFHALEHLPSIVSIEPGGRRSDAGLLFVLTTI